MTKLLSILALASMLAVTGCKTVTNTDGTTTKRVDPIVLQAVAQDATAVGTTIFLQAHPEYRTQFELAQVSVHALLAAGSGSPADLQAALSGLPIAQLKGQQGAIIVSSAVTLIDLAGAELKGVDSKQVWSNFVQPVAQGIANGLDQALATPAGGSGPTP